MEKTLHNYHPTIIRVSVKNISSVWKVTSQFSVCSPAKYVVILCVCCTSCFIDPVDDPTTLSDINIQMSDCSDGDLQLIGGNNTREGRVEVCFSKVWGSICPTFYGSEDAALICRQLNETSRNFGPGKMHVYI